MTAEDVDTVIRAFPTAALRAAVAGFLALEIHAANGYLLHEFLSPVSNRRTDSYGGSFENRTRLTLAVTRAVRSVWPERLPLFVRISVTHWLPGASWEIEQRVTLARQLKGEGVNLIDCSSGGPALAQAIPRAPGYQVPFAARIRREAGIATGAVGLITMTRHAEEIIHAGQADAVLIARQSLRDPYQIVASALDQHAPIRIMLNDGRIMLPKGVFMAKNAYHLRRAQPPEFGSRSRCESKSRKRPAGIGVG